MIVYHGRLGNYLGQDVVVPVQAPLTPVVAPAPVVVTPPTPLYQDMARYDDRVSLTKAGILVGGLVLVALTLTLSSALLRRA